MKQNVSTKAKNKSQDGGRGKVFPHIITSEVRGRDTNASQCVGRVVVRLSPGDSQGVSSNARKALGAEWNQQEFVCRHVNSAKWNVCGDGRRRLVVDANVLRCGRQVSNEKFADDNPVPSSALRKNAYNVVLTRASDAGVNVSLSIDE